MSGMSDALIRQLKEAISHAEFADTEEGKDDAVLRGVIISMRENVENALRIAGDGDRRNHQLSTRTVSS